MRNTQVNSNGVGVNRVPPGGKGIAQHTPTRTLADYAGREAVIAGLGGEQLVGFKEPELIVGFNYFINPLRVKTSASSGAWSATVDKSRLKLTAGTGLAVGDAIIESVQAIGYRPGFDAYVLCTAAFDNYVAGTEQDFGPHDDLDGYAIGLGVSGLMVSHYSGGVLVSTALQADFLLDPLDGSGLSGFEVNPQALNLWRISYGHLGVYPPSFEIFGGSHIGWIPFHCIDIVGLSNELIFEDPFLPIRFRVQSDGSAEVSMYSGSWNGGIIGAPRKKHLEDPFTVAHSTAIAAGTVPILTIRNDTTFKTKVNKIPIDLDTLTTSVDGNKNHDVELIKNGVLTGPTSYTSVDANSCVSQDVASTGISGGKLMRSYELGKISDLGPGVVFPEGSVRLLPGEWLTIVIITTSTASDIGSSMHWDELK